MSEKQIGVEEMLTAFGKAAGAHAMAFTRTGQLPSWDQVDATRAALLKAWDELNAKVEAANQRLAILERVDEWVNGGNSCIGCYEPIRTLLAGETIDEG